VHQSEWHIPRHISLGQIVMADPPREPPTVAVYDPITKQVRVVLLRMLRRSPATKLLSNSPSRRQRTWTLDAIKFLPSGWGNLQRPRRHRWSAPKGLMDADEVVMHEVDRHSMRGDGGHFDEAIDLRVDVCHIPQREPILHRVFHL
jgi:hypothetical protein